MKSLAATGLTVQDWKGQALHAEHYVYSKAYIDGFRPSPDGGAYMAVAGQYQNGNKNVKVCQDLCMPFLDGKHISYGGRVPKQSGSSSSAPNPAPVLGSAPAPGQGHASGSGSARSNSPKPGTSRPKSPRRRSADDLLERRLEYIVNRGIELLEERQERLARREEYLSAWGHEMQRSEMIIEAY